MPSPKRLSELIHAIYAAAESPERWEHFLSMLAEDIAAGMTVLLALDRNDSIANIATSVRADPEVIQLYNSDWGTQDPWATSGHASLTQEGAITLSDEMVSQRDLVRTPFYNDFARKVGINRSLTATIVVNPTMSAGLSCHYPTSAPIPSRRERDVLGLFVPHLRQALRFHQRWQADRLAASATAEALDRGQTGFILLDGGGRVLRHNRAAERVIERSDGLVLRAGRLRAAIHGEDARLRAAIAAAATTSLARGTDPGAILAIRRHALQPPYRVTVMPVSAVGLLFERYGGAVALLIVDPDREARPDARALEAGLGLTRAEAEIGIFLVAGRRPPEIARLRGVSVQTVRSQLKTIYAKVGATSRADVVRILLQGTIALARNDRD